MKKMLSIMLAVIILLSGISTYANTITIDTETATYNEVVEAINQLTTIRKNMLNEQFATNHKIEQKDEINFRGVPFHSTKKEAELTFGSLTYYDHNMIKIISGPSSAMSGDYGVRGTYQGLTVAGYPVKYTEIDYVYPIVDGVVLRNDDLAIFYIGSYKIEDLGDIDAAVLDLVNKLNNLYGEYTKQNVQGDCFVWTDINGNIVRLYQWPSTIWIMYYASDTETLLSNIKKADDNEKAQQEELLRIQNQNNTDGL